jgi:predicted transcriptional regulator
MLAHSTKQEALDVIQRLPDNVDMEEIMYRLYVLENIRRGQEDAEQGKTTPTDQVLRDIQSW